MNGLDAIIFTAGVGENDVRVREKVCQEMGFLGIQLDSQKNQERSGAVREINMPDAKVKVLVIPTNEELEIARQCFALLQ